MTVNNGYRGNAIVFGANGVGSYLVDNIRIRELQDSSPLRRQPTSPVNRAARVIRLLTRRRDGGSLPA